MSDELLVLSAVHADRTPDGSWVVPNKFIEGMAGYARLWNGPVTALMRISGVRPLSLDEVPVEPGRLPFGLEPLPAGQDLPARLSRASLVFAVLNGDPIDLHAVCRQAAVPLVYVCEHSLRVRRHIIALDVSNRLRRWKRQLAAMRLDHHLREAVRCSAGLQCNGTPAWDAYHSLSPRPLLFFDSRITACMLASEAMVRGRIARLLQGGPLRLVFSGRLLPIKGVQYLPVVAEQLRRAAVPFHLDICGDGPLAESLCREIQRRRLQEHVTLRGVLDFGSQLVPLLTKEMDLFVCCHPQGDPSCTYLETLSCGVPIAGFANDAFRGIAELSGAGWLCPVGDCQVLARRIAALHEQRSSLAAAALASLRFAGRHTFEHTWRARIDHLRACRETWRPAGEATSVHASGVASS